MFKVTGGNVTFGDNLTLSGKQVEWKCEDVPGETITDPAVFKVVWSNGVDGDNAWSETVENASGTLAHAAPTKTPGEGWTFTGWKWKESADGEAKFTTGGNTDIGYTVPTNLEKNVTMTIVAQWEKGGSGSGNLSYNDGQVFYLFNNNDVKMYPPGGQYYNTTEVTAFVKNGGVYITKPDKSEVQLNCWGGVVRLNNGGAYDKFPLVAETIDGKTYLKEVSNNSNNGKYMYPQESGKGGFYFGDTADGHDWNSKPETYNGAAPSYVESDPETHPGATTQRCGISNITVCPDVTAGTQYSTSNFGSGSEADPHGFFVEVERGATATLAGATFENFITGGKVMWAAPVVANGGTFNVSGGSIEQNCVGYNADDAKSKDGADEIKAYIEKNLARTDTAGAVIYTKGAKGSIINGTIKSNRGDTGAIAILGEGTDVQMNGGTISNNVGIHYGGAAYVYDGAFLGMGGGTMDSNYAWNKGGAVYVSDEVYGTTKWMDPKSTTPAGKSHFAFQGGSLTKNFAVNRGGAIYVESNGVVLTGGTISGNESRSLGGAIYVAGDGIQRMYQLYVSNGCITGNHAVESHERLNKQISKSATDECNFSNDLITEGALEGDNRDYNNYAGYGGGLWLCSFGGNATFGYQEGFNVIIDGNDAVDKAGRAGTKKGGQDIKLRPTRPGEGSAINVIGNADANNNLWVNETTGKNVVINQTYTGPLPIRNDRNDQACDSALQITNNMARVGGGIAANGTVIFGPAQDVYRIHTRLDIKKTWDGIAQKDREDITLSLAFKDADGTVYPLEGYEYTLDGNITPEDEITENTTMWESGVYQAAFGLPLVYQKADGTVVPVFTFTDPDDSNNKLDPSKPEQLKIIWQHFKDGKLTDNDAKLNFDLVVTEKIEGQEASEKGYVFSAEDVKFTSKATEGTPHVYYDKGKKEITEMKTNVLELSFTQDVKNKKGEEEKPEIEKYVNQAVHADVDLDETFTYDIIAYVTNDADKLTITDELRQNLQFATTQDEVEVYDLGTDVNHLPYNDISGNKITYNEQDGVTPVPSVSVTLDEAITNANSVIDDSTLTVTLDNDYEIVNGVKTYNSQALTPYRGHWILVRFKAQLNISPEDIGNLSYEEVDPTSEDNDREKPNVGNAPVVSDEKHKGIINNVSYSIGVGNNYNCYSDTSNDVTVKPSTENIEITKVWSGDTVADRDEAAFKAALKLSAGTEDVTQTYSSKLKVTKDDTRNTWTAKWTDLPKLTGVTYSVTETQLQGYDAPVYANNDDTSTANVDESETTDKALNGGKITNTKTTIQNVTAELKAKKILLDEDKNPITGGEYTFKLSAEDNATPMPANYDAETGINVAAGSEETFGTITYPAEEKTYNYTVTEVADTTDTTTVYDGTTVNVTVSVKQDNDKNWISEVKYERADDSDTDDNESEADVATFVNKKIKEGTVKAHLEAEKILYNTSTKANMTVPEGAFTFEVIPVGNAPALTTATKATGTDGKAVFEDITFNAKGEYKYKIKEVIPDSANQVKGINYDTAEVTATVKVEVDETNTDRTVVKFKQPTVTYERTDDEDTADNETYTNKFVNKTDNTEIEITKVWENADEGDKNVEQFMTFLKLFKKAASGTEEADWAEVQGAVPTVTGDVTTDNWTVKYGGLTRYLAGTLIEYVYSVVETAPEGFVASYKQAEAQTATENERALDEGTITNVKPEIEKYVNNDVHADLETYDKEFIYDVIAYVPKDATEITITDKLDSKLEFVSDKAAIEASAVWIEPSNHKAGSVAVAEGENRSVEETGEKVEAIANIAQDQTLTVNVKNIGTEEGQQAIGGKSVRITFTAKIKANDNGTYTVLEDSDLYSVIADEPVETQLSGDAGHKAGDHKGIKNQASYTIKTANDAEANPKYKEIPSNEVTVVPETIKFEGKKSWTGEFTDEDKDNWPDEVESVTFNLVKVNGEERTVVDTVTLTSKKQSDSFEEQPKLEGVTYEVVEAAVEGYMKQSSKSETNNTTGVMTTTITNEKKPEIEKYVEKDVHADLVNFDKEFTYDVIAYVPTDATAITISDKLNSNLDYVSTPEQIEKTAVAIAQSNHIAKTGSVVSSGGGIIANATIDGDNLLTVRVEDIGNEEGQQNIGGKSVRITFKAKIKDEIRDLTKFTENVTTDTPVITELDGEAGHKAGDHTGIKNQAKYTIEIDNEGTSKPEYTDVPSNEVTVIPEMAKFAGTKSWTGEFTDADEDEWPDEVESVTFNLVKVEGNNRTVVETKTINKDTEDRTVRFADQPKLENVSYEVEEEFSTKYSVAKTESATGTEDGVTTVTITNKPGEPEIEKYVNDDVHADLGEFDKVFKYDIMAYVTNDATSVVIEDPLTTALEFAKVPADGTESTDSAQKAVSAAETIKAIVTKTSNDHKAGGSVSGTDSEAVSAEKYNAEIVNGNALKVTIDGIDDNTGVRGKWVQITFFAKYTDAVIAAATAGDFTQVSRNGAVISEKYPNVADDAQEGTFAHEGTVNKASYTITAGNRSYDKVTTNEVTVKPDKAKIEVAKTWGNNSTEWPADIDSVTVALFAKKGETVTEVKGTVADDGSFTAGGNAQATYVLNRDKKQVTITGLPKLIGTEYYAQEIKVDDTAVTNGTKYGQVKIGLVEYIVSYIDALKDKGTDNERYSTTVNNEKIEVEKYVNNNVHADLVEFDKVFKYDVLAYVSKDATEVTITDSLVSALEFAKPSSDLNAKAQKAANAAEANVAVTVKDSNDHKVGGTVAKYGQPVIPTSVDVENNTLTVKFDNVDDNTGIRGKWIQVTFYAKYTDAIIEAANIGDTAKVTNNGAVLGGKTPHDGTGNEAHYTMKVGNDATVDIDTNKVTVKPETTKVYVKKQVQDIFGNAKTVWPSGLSVKANVYKNTEGSTSEPEIVQTLTINGLEAVESKVLPKLKGVTYTVDEVLVPAGYEKVGDVTGKGTEADPYVITNKSTDKPEVEKYVNNYVTYDFDNFDQEFEYEIMGLVPADAKVVEFTDKLNGVLEFVSKEADVKVYDMGTENNHINTVENSGREVEAAKYTAVIDPAMKTLTVTFGSEDDPVTDATGIRGKWLKVTFKARITQALYDAVAAKIAEKATSEDRKAIDVADEWENISDNKNVQITKTHDGVPNRAGLRVKVENGGEFTADTNTVTVEPKTEELKATKVWKDAEGADMTTWPAGAKVTFALMKGGEELETKTLDKAGTVTFTAQPKLDGVTYTVVEKSVEGIDALQDGDATIEGNTWTFTNKVEETPEEPEIEKYVNKKDATPEDRDGTVHTDLYAFDEVYTYDIQAYVTNDAKYVVVSDQLVEVLEFANTDKFRVVYKDGEGVDGTVAPKLSKEGTTITDYRVDFGTGTANKLVVEFGEDAESAPVLDYAGKWLQITFDAKIKDDYRTIDALKAKGVKVWTTITENDPVEDADVSEEDSFSGATAESHEGIINDASYTINKIAGAEPGNEWEYSDKSNTVTVQPEMTEIEAKKLWYGSTDKWPEDIGSVTVGLFKLVFSINDNLEFEYKVEPVNGTIDHNGNLIPGGNKQAVYKLTKDESSKTIKLPNLSNVIYYFDELEVDGTPVKSNGKLDSVGIANMGIFDIVASYMRPIFWIDIPDPETGETVTDFGIGTVVNNEKIETEKYVNNNVHADLVEFDKVFKYDILAYVSSEATEVTITDTLVDALEFAKPSDDLEAKAEAAANEEEAGIKVAVKAENDHKVDGTVKTEGTTVSGADVTIKDNKLTVAFKDDETTDENELADIQGKWLQVTFYAKYTDAVIDAANIGDTETVNNNGAVLNGVTPHDGTANKAHYTMNVGNDAKVDLDTNTVTVKPETTKIYVQKKVQNPDGTDAEWPLGLKVKARVYKNEKGKDPVEIRKAEITIDSAEKKASIELPKLIGVTYTADEVEIPSGYTKVGNVTGKGTEAEPYVITNKKDDKPEIEKYVNKDVHQSLVEFDRAFTYDIMAYITKDADKAVISDTLVNALEFSKTGEGKGEASVVPAEVVAKIVTKDGNDHTANSTVASDTGTDVSDKATVEINGKTLTVTFGGDTDETKIKPEDGLRGKWVQITFYAKYTDETIAAAEVLDAEAVKDNGAVISATYPSVAETAANPAHEGTKNNASYEIFVNNESKYNSKSNTVTVDAETVEVTAKKEWKNADGTTADWPVTEVERVPIEVKVNVMNGDKVVDTITLTKDKPEGKSKELPKLIGVEYTLDEETEVPGWYSSVDGNTVTNILGKPKVEKYVNNNVTYDFDNFDQVFEYEIMGYVPADAATVTFTDKLVDSLKFANGGSVAMYAMGAQNNHQNTVALEGEYIDPANYSASAKDGVLTVSVAEEDIEPLRGQWVKVTFEARIKESAYKMVADKIAEKAASESGKAASVTDKWENIEDNGSVKIKTKHDGVPNKASYSVEVQNGGKFTSDTNTVTVEPETTEITAEKQWKNNKGETAEWPKDAAGEYAPKEIIVKVMKVKGDTEEQAKDAAGNPVTIKLTPTAASGKAINLPKLEGVTYKIKEDTVVPGYTSTVDGNVVTNTRDVKKHDVEISKNSLGGSEIAGAHIVLYNADGSVADEWDSTTEAHIVKLAEGTYTMVETVAPEGYQCVTTAIEFTVDEDGKVTLTTVEVDNNGEISVAEGTDNHIILEDAPNPDITISKSSLGGKEIEGAVIVLKDDKGNLVDTWVSTTETHTIEKLAPGRYVMKETVAPEGYQQVTTDMIFVVDKDGNVTLETTVVDGGGRLTAEADHINLEDAPIKPVSVVLEAVKTLADASGARTLQEGEFTFTLSGKDVSQTKTNAADGKVTFDTIEFGYGFDENGKATSTPVGTHTFIIKETKGDDANIVYDTGIKSVTVKVTKSGNDLATVVTYSGGTAAFTNKVIQPGEATAQIFADKKLTVNGTDGTPGAGEFTFEIRDRGATYYVDGSETPMTYENSYEGAGVLDTVTNDAEGIIDFGTFTYEYPGEYRYFISEVNTGEDGVTYDTAVHTVVVTVTESAAEEAQDGTVTKKLTAVVSYPDGKTFTNTKNTKKPVVISKKDFVSGYELPGAKLTISGDNLEEPINITSSTEPVVVELLPGSYTLTEIEAPSGYIITDPIPFTVGEDGLVDADNVVEMTNSSEKIHDRFTFNVSVEKKWTDGHGNEVSWPKGMSVEFTLQYYDKYSGEFVNYEPYGAPVTVTLTQADQIGVFEELEANIDGAAAQYRAVETKVAGYTQATSTVTNLLGGVGIMTATNIPEVPGEKEFEVKISKNSLGGTEIEGAHIVVYGADGSKVAEWTSAKEPHLLTLKAGTYTMVETVAPEGYKQVTTAITFTVDNDGKVTLGTTTVDNGGKISVMDANHLILEDAPEDKEKHQVLISKTDLGGTEIEGATIVLKDSEGKVIKEWTSTKDAFMIELPAGTYTMIETVAPVGYEKVTTEMTFTVGEDGKVTLVTTKVDNGGQIEVLDGNHIVLKDAPTKTPEEEKKKPDVEKPTESRKTTVPTTTRRVVTPTASSAQTTRGTSTGDSNNTALWIVLAAAAAGALAGAAVFMRRRRYDD